MAYIYRPILLESILGAFTFNMKRRFPVFKVLIFGEHSLKIKFKLLYLGAWRTALLIRAGDRGGKKTPEGGGVLTFGRSSRVWESSVLDEAREGKTRFQSGIDTEGEARGAIPEGNEVWPTRWGKEHRFHHWGGVYAFKILNNRFWLQYHVVFTWTTCFLQSFEDN